MSYSLTNIVKTTWILLSIYVAVGFCQSFASSSKTIPLGGTDTSIQKSYLFYNETIITIYSVDDQNTLYTNLLNRTTLASLPSQTPMNISNGIYGTSTTVEESGVTYGYFVMKDIGFGNAIVKIALFPQLGTPEVVFNDTDSDNETVSTSLVDATLAFANSDSLFVITTDQDSTINRFALHSTANLTLTGSSPIFREVFTSGFLDDTIGYFGTSGGKIWSIDLSLIEGRVNNVTLDHVNTTYTAIETAVFDSIRRFGYFFADDNTSDSSVLFKFDLDTFSIIDSINPQNSLISDVISADIDLIGGQIYFGTSTGSFGHFSLPKFAFDGKIVSTVDSIRFHSVSLDISKQQAFFMSSESSAYQVSLPQLCANNCSSRGSCQYESCNCTAGYGGPDCSWVLCPNNCNGGGTCDYKSGNCSCFSGFTGDDCSTQQCKSNCLGNGICNVTSFTCICDAGYYGDDCSKQIPPICSDFRSCDQCLSNTSCGWCASTSLCTEGDLEGPHGDGYGCTMWYYDHCPAVAMTAFSAIFTGIAAILLLINMCSVFIGDKNAPGRADEFEVRRGYWRNQRSAKLWHMIDQIQFAAITAQFAVKVPSIYNEFVSIFRWSVFGFPLPWSQTSQHFPSRKLLSIAQYATSTLAFPVEIFYGNLFWFGVLLGVVTVFFVLVKIYASLWKRDNLTDFVKYRYVYTLLRLLFFAYFPLTVTGAYVIGYGNVTSAIIAAIYLGVVHLGLILFIFKLIPRQRSSSHKLFKSEFLRKFGCIYQTFYFRRSWYSVLLLIKKLIMGLIIGFGQKSPVGTLVLLIVVNVVYVVQLFFVKPYLDHVHMFLDIITSVFNILVVLLMFSFLDGVADKTTTNIITIFVTMFLLITMVICVVTYFNSWFKMKNIHSLRQLWERIRGRDQNDPEKSPDLNADLELTTKTD